MSKLGEQKSRRPPQASSTQINLLGALEILHKHLTDVLCENVFHAVRNRERQRKWSLHALAWFWTTIILQPPTSLTHALESVHLGKNPLVPLIPASAESFFKKCKAMPIHFFQHLFEAFIQAVLPESPRTYAPPIHCLLKNFSGIWAVDGSRLDEIPHRLKDLWKEASVVLPGCLTVYYDLIRGISRHILVDPDAAKAELGRAESLLDVIPQGTLILGDRLYASIRFLSELTSRQLWGLFRLNHHLKVKKDRLIQRRQGGGRSVIEEWRVTVGCGVGQPPVLLRLIVSKQGRIRRELLTNVLDPRVLSAKQALELYPLRWTIERLFFDLKEVLDLHHFYAANPNAVAMQVYATAIVHTAFRIAQAKIAQKNKIAPEMISPPKLFVRLAVASIGWAGGELYYLRMLQLNPGKHLNKPDWKDELFAHTTLQAILVQKRKSKRRELPKRTPRRWKSLAHVQGLKLS